MNKKPLIILVILAVLITWLVSFCNRPDCINNNPVFDKFDPETIEYRNELKNQIEKIGKDKLNFWIFNLKRIDGVDYLKLYVQSDQLCAILFAKNLSGKAISKFPDRNLESSLGYHGARLVNVELNIDTTLKQTNFVIEKIGSILD